jgi:hypothetical protein
MKMLTIKIQEEAVLLINQLRSGTLSDKELSDIVTKLRKLLPDPYFMAYAIDIVPELSAEEVVRRAFEYKPIQL